MKKTRKDKGITLIALIITIVVLLILALVTINSITGDDSLIAHANNAKSKYTDEAENENSLIAKYLDKLSDYGDDDDDDNGYIKSIMGIISTDGNEKSYAKADIDSNNVVTINTYTVWNDTYLIEENTSIVTFQCQEANDMESVTTVYGTTVTLESDDLVCMDSSETDKAVLVIKNNLSRVIIDINMGTLQEFDVENDDSIENAIEFINGLTEAVLVDIYNQDDTAAKYAIGTGEWNNIETGEHAYVIYTQSSTDDLKISYTLSFGVSGVAYTTEGSNIIIISATNLKDIIPDDNISVEIYDANKNE